MSSSPADESTKLLLKAFEYFDGTIDFAKFASDHDITTAEAVRKRFKRYYQAHNLNVNQVGDKIGPSATKTATKAPATPKGAAATALNTTTPDSTSKARKRKSAQAVEGNDVFTKQSPAAKKSKPAAKVDNADAEEGLAGENANEA